MNQRCFSCPYRCEDHCNWTGHSLATYLHECPYCHVIHEGNDQLATWCREHVDKKKLYDRRNRDDRRAWKWDWACPGCEQCEEERCRLLTT